MAVYSDFSIAFFTLWPLSADIWLILRYIQHICFNSFFNVYILQKSVRYLIEIWSIFSWYPFIIPLISGWYPWYPDIRCTDSQQVVTPSRLESNIPAVFPHRFPARPSPRRSEAAPLVCSQIKLGIWWMLTFPPRRPSPVGPRDRLCSPVNVESSRMPARRMPTTTTPSRCGARPGRHRRRHALGPRLHKEDIFVYLIVQAKLGHRCSFFLSHLHFSSLVLVPISPRRVFLESISITFAFAGNVDGAGFPPDAKPYYYELLTLHYINFKVAYPISYLIPFIVKPM